MSKFQMQSRQYSFPYHYIPHFDQGGTPSIVRGLSWGLEYLCYQDHVRDKVLDIRPESLLEIGCGDGFFLGRLENCVTTCVGVDLSERAIAFAKAFWPDCEFLAWDAAKLNRAFDLVVAIEVLEHVADEDVETFIHVLHDRVKPGGKVVICVPTVVLPLNEKHHRHYSFQMLEAQIVSSGAPLHIVEVEYIYWEPAWLTFFLRLCHNRLWTLELRSVMRWIWRKIWEEYRFADAKSGRHMVVVLSRQ